MGIPPSAPQSGRRIEADGQVWIVCSICAKQIQKVTYGIGGQRFSTAICYKCDKGLAAGKTPDELIYEAVQEEIKQADEVRETIGSGMFKAIGMKQKITEVAQEIKKRIVTRRRKITEE